MPRRLFSIVPPYITPLPVVTMPLTPQRMLLMLAMRCLQRQRYARDATLRYLREALCRDAASHFCCHATPAPLLDAARCYADAFRYIRARARVCFATLIFSACDISMLMHTIRHDLLLLRPLRLPLLDAASHWRAADALLTPCRAPCCHAHVDIDITNNMQRAKRAAARDVIVAIIFFIILSACRYNTRFDMPLLLLLPPLIRS